MFYIRLHDNFTLNVVVADANVEVDRCTLNMLYLLSDVQHAVARSLASSDRPVTKAENRTSADQIMKIGWI